MNTRLLKLTVTALVIAHLAGNVWHGDAHAVLEIYLPGAKIAFVVVVILLAPVAGAVLMWTQFAIAGCWTVGVSMAASVVFSVYHHYVMISNDNVEHLPPGSAEEHAHFANSAEFIAFAAFAAALFAFYAAGKMSTQNTGINS